MNSDIKNNINTILDKETIKQDNDFSSLIYNPKKQSILSNFMKYYTGLVINNQYIFPFSNKCKMAILFRINSDENGCLKLSFPYECYSRDIRLFTSEFRGVLWNEKLSDYIMSMGTWNKLSSQLSRTLKNNNYYILYPNYIGKFRTIIRKTWKNDIKKKSIGIKDWDILKDGNGYYRYLPGQLIIKILKKYNLNDVKNINNISYANVNIYNPNKNRYETRNIILPKELIYFKRLILAYNKYF